MFNFSPFPTFLRASSSIFSILRNLSNFQFFRFLSEFQSNFQFCLFLSDFHFCPNFRFLSNFQSNFQFCQFLSDFHFFRFFDFCPIFKLIFNFADFKSNQFFYFVGFDIIAIFNFCAIFNFWSIFNFVLYFDDFVQFSILSRALDWNFQSCLYSRWHKSNKKMSNFVYILFWRGFSLKNTILIDAILRQL